MRSEGYSTLFVCHCVCLINNPGVSSERNADISTSTKCKQYSPVFRFGDFANNAWFKTYGKICKPRSSRSSYIACMPVVTKIFNDEAEYERWISFKHHDYEDWFKKRFSFTQVDFFWRLCRRVLAQREGYSWDRDSQQIVF